MSLDYSALFREMASQLQVKEAVRKSAEQLKEYMGLRWPEVNQLNDAQRSFLEKSSEQVILIREAAEGTNRPVHIVTVRCPDAVSHQAKTSFVARR
ncbi:hypothetical protein [Corynebacterium ulcerans]|uniref:hypothetical protein n=1 Tax=Corynebacterium ulcerans TaxID=65058 RepID=UPI0034A0DB38